MSLIPSGELKETTWKGPEQTHFRVSMSLIPSGELKVCSITLLLVMALMYQ